MHEREVSGRVRQIFYHADGRGTDNFVDSRAVNKVSARGGCERLCMVVSLLDSLVDCNSNSQPALTFTILSASGDSVTPHWIPFWSSHGRAQKFPKPAWTPA